MNRLLQSAKCIIEITVYTVLVVQSNYVEHASIIYVFMLIYNETIKFAMLTSVTFAKLQT
jgi:hypothetical protein